MKSLFLFSLLLFSLISFGQGEWQAISPSPTANSIQRTYFVNPELGWLIASNGTILKTSDGGESWITQYQNIAVNTQDLFFIDENEGWVCCHKSVLHTTDGGDSWEETTLPGQYVSAASIYFANHDIGWVSGSYDRIYKTTNGGDTWYVVNSGFYSTPTWLIDISFFDENIGIAVGGYIVGNDTAVILTTDDGGINWDSKHFPSEKSLKSVSYVTKEVIIASSVDGHIFRSLDGGDSWGIKYIGKSLDDICFFDDSTGIAISSDQIVYTYDGGQNWEEGDYIDASTFAFSNSVGFAVGHQQNIYKTINFGKDWVQINNSPTFGSLENLSYADSSTIWASRWNDPYLAKTTDGGYNWEIINIDADNDILSVEFFDENIGFAIEKKEVLHKTIDGGEHWSKIHLNTGVKPTCFEFANPEKVYLGGEDGLLQKSTDGGKTWTNISPANITPTKSEVFLDIIALDEMKLWVLSTSGSVYFSDDSGNSWTEKEVITFGNLIGFYFFNENEGFAIADYGAQYTTDDGGNTWQESDFSPAYNAPLKIDFFNNEEGWIIKGARLLYTLDKGNTWSNSISLSGMKDIAFLPPYTGMICGHNGLIMKYNESITKIPQSVAKKLFVYPNPTSSELHIRYTNSISPENLHLEIVDILGRSKQIQFKAWTKEEFSINISSWEKGLYIASIIDDDGQVHRIKFVIH